MKLTVLTENMAGDKFLAEHGLSYLIEHNGQRILFDTGHSNVFLENSNLMGYTIQNSIDIVVLSHGHWDHGDGLQYIRNKTLITHPNSFIKRFRKGGKQNIGLALSKSEIKKRFNLIESASPYFITKDIIFLGGIPRVNNFESQTTSFTDEQGNDDFVPDDSALAIIQNNELIIITGCSHAGICNIVDYAIKISKVNKVKVIMGGFHLKKEDAQTKKTIDYLKHLSVETILPSHCTQLPAMAAFYNEFKMQQVKTGQEFLF
jgi:7,8-dihydropterin-6-yl-methyl-4-(beta-D-ribofuranosyl)aminobenzene 5'-phosphate synthase